MGLSICPVANVAAPIEDVWELLTQPSRYDEWSDAHVERVVPAGPLAEGQTIYLSSRALGKRWNITFVIEKVDPEKHQVDLTVTLPLGVKNHEHITCTPIDATSCRVQYG